MRAQYTIPTAYCNTRVSSGNSAPNSVTSPQFSAQGINISALDEQLAALSPCPEDEPAMLYIECRQWGLPQSSAVRVNFEAFDASALERGDKLTAERMIRGDTDLAAHILLRRLLTCYTLPNLAAYQQLTSQPPTLIRAAHSRWERLHPQPSPLEQEWAQLLWAAFSEVVIHS